MALPLLETPDAAAAWLAARGAQRLATDSRRVAAGDAFIAWPGHAHDARHYVQQALDAGAVACLIEAEAAEAFAFDDPRIATIGGLKAAAGAVASRFFGAPSERLRIIAITGTNGKTSTAWWTAQALSAIGERCAVVGTIGSGEPAAASTAAFGDLGLTTPDPVALQETLAAMADRGGAACALEASSIGLVEQRLAGTHIDTAVYTNFSQDHLDYHGDMEAYWQAKAQLFAWPGLRAAVVNVDDERGAELDRTLPRDALDVWSYSMHQAARLRARQVRVDAGLAFEVVEGESQAAVATALIGRYNVANLLAVIGCLRAAGFPLSDAAAACAGLGPVPGRLQRIVGQADAPLVIVDYAHTPDALENVLLSLQPVAAQRGGRLWCVFGCGGNRDPHKRPLMGALARRLAQRVVVTSDNPRFESADFIISQILTGVIGHDEVDVIENRAAAIAHAIEDAEPRDVVLLAGKGHEDYQEIGGERLPFSDAAHAAAALARRAAR
jgi:UDP-N-acetylmuramoyl-L-alanyl-D-glutamate--2,6-diaminopimelate ligase